MKLKIKSNPYNDEIRFYKFTNDGWNEINVKDSEEADNKLLEKRIQNGFFPFLVHEIMDIIIKDYGDNIEIEFEGPKDFFNDLVEIIKCDRYKNVKLTQSFMYLEDGKDILDSIMKIYDDAQDLIEKSILDKKMISEDKRKLLEVGNDKIPLCVIGNYSSGKSTFINALIGREILPSGLNPVTSHVCKIVKSKYKSVKKIKFNSNNEEFIVTFDGEEYDVKSSKVENELIKFLENELESIKKDNSDTKLNKILDVINKKDNIENIEIEVPFTGGLLEKTDKDFVIFDTPGSDSSTYKKHLEVLLNELKKLSNGLIIFIADRLDSNGNESLYKELKNIEELDSRFTMIVVNKSDVAELPNKGYFDESEIKSTLDLVLPRMMYSNGIYFVSSIMGIGSKNSGFFINEYHAESYESNIDKYENEENKHYKQLYMYNIMPDQLKNKVIEDSKKCDNKVYVNSGMFAVEHEILTYADNYSAYNKSRQAKIYLTNVIKIVNDEINNRIDRADKVIKNIKENLEEKKKVLCNLLESNRDECKNIDDNYNKIINIKVDNIKKKNFFTLEVLTKQVNDLEKQYAEKNGYYELKENNKNEIKNKVKNGQEQFQELFAYKQNDKDNNKVVDIGLSVIDLVKALLTNTYEEIIEERKINYSVSIDLFNIVKKEYDKISEYISNEIYEESCELFNKKMEDTKVKFLKLIDANNDLTEEQKQILNEVIVNYEKIKFTKTANDVFAEKKIKKRWLSFFDCRFYRTNDLLKTLNDNISSGTDEVYNNISNSHLMSFEDWVDELVKKIVFRIVDFNPELSEKKFEYNEEEKKKKLLNKDKGTLTNYLVKLDNLTDWKIDNK